MKKTLCFLSKNPSQPIVSVALAPSTPHRDFTIDMCIASAASIISKWNTETSAYASITSIFYEDKSEAMNFLKCVKDLQSSMHSLASSNSCSDKLFEAQALMQVAMKTLQKEFYQVLSTNHAHLNSESVSAWWSSSSSRASTSSDNQDQGSAKYDGAIMSQLPVPMADLRSIAECMISSGYTKECLHVYMMARKSVIDEGIHRLGIERMSSLQINKMNWEATELRITNWLAGLKVAIGTLFTGERILCDHVFASSDSIREFCFAGISAQGATILFGFPENIVVKSKKLNGNEMFRILDMYKTITESWQEIESVFSYKSTSTVLSQAITLLSKLGESVRGFISRFEENIRKDSSKTLVPGGGVHPLTVHAMNHLSFLVDYSVILNDILAYGTPPMKIRLADDESYFDSPESYDSQSQAISLHFTRILLVLLCKLDGKAKHYKDLSLSYLFLANNMQHVVSRVRTSNIRCFLSDKWITNHEAKVRQFAEKHQGLAWGNVMGSFPENPTALVSAEEAREYFKRFNMHFNVACRKQRSFVVSDPNLGKEIKMSIARRVVPVYRQLYDTHRYLDSLARLTPKDVLNHISNILLETAT